MLRYRYGFTLIELLVVIAIIAILAAILFPVFTKARESARQTRCLGNMSQLARAFRTYLNDYDGTFPTGAPFDRNPQHHATDWVHTHGSDPYWFDTVEHAREAITSGSLYPYVRDETVYMCPSDKEAKRKRLSYSMNSYLYDRFNFDIGIHMTEIRWPSKIILLVNEWSGPGEAGLNDGFYVPINSMADIPQPVHNEGACYAFCDGHVKWIAAREVYNPTRGEWAHEEWFNPW